MILEGDCFDLIKEQPDNSVDLIITSPPYADIVNYGKNISIKKPNEYVDWIIPLFKEIYRVLKPSGSFILNINDNCSNGLRNTFIYDLISRNNIETKLKLYDTYIWHKKNGIPNGAAKRFRNTTEFIFHFIKNKKEFKFYMDRVLVEEKVGAKLRNQYPHKYSFQGDIFDGERRKKVDDVKKSNGDLVRPDNVFRFSTAGASRDNHIKHPAPFHKDLPLYFINLLTDENDLVIDVFAGIGTTGVACKELNRQFVGYELNPKYAEFGNKRISGDELETHRVVQYDLDGNYIADYKNRMEASRATGIPDCDIMRTYNRTKFDSRGGYIWKLEPEYVINQYDMEDNFIRSYSSTIEAEKLNPSSSQQHIQDCIRAPHIYKSWKGYKWKLENNNYAKK